MSCSRRGRCILCQEGPESVFDDRPEPGDQYLDTRYTLHLSEIEIRSGSITVSSWQQYFHRRDHRSEISQIYPANSHEFYCQYTCGAAKSLPYSWAWRHMALPKKQILYRQRKYRHVPKAIVRSD